MKKNKMNVNKYFKRIVKVGMVVLLAIMQFSIKNSSIEAQSSFPNPGNENDIDVQKYFSVPSLGAAKNAAYPDTNYKNVVHLTDDVNEQFGTMWANDTVNLKHDFDIKSKVYMYSHGNNRIADGIAFVVQGDLKGKQA